MSSFTFSNTIITDTGASPDTAETIIRATTLEALREDNNLEFVQPANDASLINFTRMITEMATNLLTLDEMFQSTYAAEEVDPCDVETAFAFAFFDHLVSQWKHKYAISENIRCDFKLDTEEATMRIIPTNSFTNELMRYIGEAITMVDQRGIETQDQLFSDSDSN